MTTWLLCKIYEYLQCKQVIVIAIDAKILEASEGNDEIEAEVLKAEETTTSI